MNANLHATRYPRVILVTVSPRSRKGRPAPYREERAHRAIAYFNNSDAKIDRSTAENDKSELALLKLTDKLMSRLS